MIAKQSGQSYSDTAPCGDTRREKSDGRRPLWPRKPADNQFQGWGPPHGLAQTVCQLPKGEYAERGCLAEYKIAGDGYDGTPGKNFAGAKTIAQKSRRQLKYRVGNEKERHHPTGLGIGNTEVGFEKGDHGRVVEPIHIVHAEHKPGKKEHQICRWL